MTAHVIAAIVDQRQVAAMMRRLAHGATGFRMLSGPRMLSLVAMLNLCWLECSENPAVFCYRIGWDLLAPVFQWRRGGNPPPACSI